MGRTCLRGSVRLLVVLALIGGCGGLPSAGPVVQVSDDDPPGESVVRYAPAPPQVDAEPHEIVEGFLDAMLAYPVSTVVAKSYLTAQAADDWNSSSGLRIYSDQRTTQPVRIGDAEPAPAQIDVVVQTDEQGALDRSGRYRRSDEVVDHRFTLEQVDGQWRIASPPDGLLVTSRFFDTYYRPLNAYYFDATGGQLIAVPVHVPVGEQAATAAMASLAAGPPESVASEFRTYLPSADAWRPSVTIDDEGVAEVEFDVDVGGLGDGVRNRWSAQVVRTLAQVPGVERVRILGSAGPLTAGGSAEQSLTAWRRFLPSDPLGRVSAVVDERVVWFDGQTPVPVDGPLGEDAGGVVGVAVGENVLAAVTGDAQIVATRGGGAEQTAEVADPVATIWDADAALWVLDRPAGQSRLRIMSPDAVREVTLVDAGEPVTSFALDAGARRYAMTIGDGPEARLVVGLVERDQRSTVTGLQPGTAIAADVVGVGSVSWASESEVLLLGDSASGRQVYRAGIDGSPATGGDAGATPRLPDVEARELAVGPGETPSLYVTDGRDRVWHLGPGGAWRLLGAAVTGGLNSGR